MEWPGKSRCPVDFLYEGRNIATYILDGGLKMRPAAELTMMYMWRSTVWPQILMVDIDYLLHNNYTARLNLKKLRRSTVDLIT